MKNEFTLAFNEVLEEKGLPREIIIKALESAIISAYNRSVKTDVARRVEASIDLETGKITIFAEKEVVEDLIVAAIKDAQAKGAARLQAEMQKMADELGIPPGTKLPF